MPRTILVADDSSTIRRIIELSFSDSDIRVEAVSSGADALDRMAVLRPDLILADVVMPHPSGYEICRAVKDSDRPVPVVLLAGTFESFDAALAEECGADDHLVKPFEADDLREKVLRLLGSPVAGAEEPETRNAAALPEPESPQVVQPAQYAQEPHETESTLPAPDPQLVDAVARAIVGRLSTDVLREVAREVVPEIATRIIRERIRELESDD